MKKSKNLRVKHVSPLAEYLPSLFSDCLCFLSQVLGKYDLPNPNPYPKATLQQASPRPEHPLEQTCFDLSISSEMLQPLEPVLFLLHTLHTPFYDGRTPDQNAGLLDCTLFQLIPSGYH